MNKEEKNAIEYYQNKEVSFSADFDTEKLLKALGITEEDSFQNHQIRFKTLLNLIEKLQKENEELKKEIERQKDINTVINEKGLDKNYEKALEKTMTKFLKNNIANDFISKQTVKDKIEKEIKYHEKNILDIENVNMLKTKTAKEEAEIEFNKYAIVVLKKILQELIEERE